MTDRELIESFCSINVHEVEMTEWEHEFLCSMEDRLTAGVTFHALTPKQRSCTEDLLKKLEAQGSEPVKITPPPGAEKYLRKRKAWEE